MIKKKKDQQLQFDFSRTAFCSLFSVFLYWSFLLSNPFEFASFKLLRVVSYSLNYMCLFLWKYLLFSELLVWLFSSVAQLCPTFSDPMNRSTPGLSVHRQLRSLFKLMSIKSVMPSSHLILCCPLLLLPPIPPSISVFSNESTRHIRWPKYWSFSFSISPSNEHPGLSSFRMDWLDVLAVQGTLKSLLQHHSSKASIFWRSAFFIVQLSHPYMTTGKTTALTRQTFVGKVMSLLFNMLSRLVITFLPRSKRLLISWLQSPSAVILESQKIMSVFPLFPHLPAMKWWDQMPWS